MWRDYFYSPFDCAYWWSFQLHIIKEHLPSHVSKDSDVLLRHNNIAVYTFLCNQCFRRDEYDEHYDLQHINSEDFIERCPMYLDGCSFFYQKKTPAWGTLR